MSRNPYDSPDPMHDVAEFDEIESPRRTSLLAIFSLLLTIPCIVPGAGLLAATMGGVSLGLIRRARGRLTGRAPAIVAIFLGIFVTVAQAAILMGLAQAYTYYTKQMAPVTDAFFVAAGQGDADRARSSFSTSAAPEVTDERLTSFVAAISATVGDITGTSTDPWQLIESFSQIYSSSRSTSSTIRTGPSSGNSAAPVPFRVDTSAGSFVGVAVFDSDTVGSAGGPKLLDAMAILPGARAVVLRVDGPATDVAAAAYGVVIISHAEAIEQAAQSAVPGAEAPVEKDATKVPEPPAPLAPPDAGASEDPDAASGSAPPAATAF